MALALSLSPRILATHESTFCKPLSPSLSLSSSPHPHPAPISHPHQLPLSPRPFSLAISLSAQLCRQPIESSRPCSTRSLFFSPASKASVPATAISRSPVSSSGSVSSWINPSETHMNNNNMTGHHFRDTRKQRCPVSLIIRHLSSQRAQQNLQQCIIHPLIGTLIDSIDEVFPADKTNLYSVLPPIEEDTRDKVFGRRGPFSYEYLLTPEDCTPYRKAEKEEIYVQTTSLKLKKRMCKWEKMKKGSCAFGSSCRYHHD